MISTNDIRLVIGHLGNTGQYLFHTVQCIFLCLLSPSRAVLVAKISQKCALRSSPPSQKTFFFFWHVTAHFAVANGYVLIVKQEMYSCGINHVFSVFLCSQSLKGLENYLISALP